MWEPAPTGTPTTAVTSAWVRSGQASLGGAAVADGAVAATTKMARIIGARLNFERMS
jgi:FAD/FMN-containing dehydrogenase